MTTQTVHRPGVELQLALAAVVAGHHDAKQAGRERARRAGERVTLSLALVAAAVISYDILLLA